MPNNLTVQQFAQILKQRDPRLANYPDEVIVRKVLERRPEMMGFLQRAQARPPLGKPASIRDLLYQHVKQAVQNMGTAAVQRHQHPEQLAPLVPSWMAPTFRTGGPVDVFGRLWTPGAKGTQVQPGEDLFYRQRIQKIMEGLKHPPTDPNP